VENLTIPAGLNVTIPDFLSLVWPAGASPGPYTIEIFGTQVNAAADGEIATSDIVASAFDSVTFVP
jgi:hypothetical protein